MVMQVQIVYNANKLANLVEENKKKQNWLDYYQLKYSRNPDNRPSTKAGFLGLCGEKVDAINHYTSEIERLRKEIVEEKDRVKTDTECIMPSAFVSFKTRYGAAICAQTRQTRNPTIWLTDWAPEPRDVFWPNLAIPYVHLTIRRLVITVAFFFMTFFFMIPIAFIQSLATIEGIQKVAPFLKPIVERIPKTIGVAVPMKATFFITYTMLDGWAGVAGEILRLKPLIIYHLKNFFLVKTKKDREAAMDAGSIGFNTGEPKIQIYILLGLVYAVVTPVLLPFILVFFGFSFVVFRHQSKCSLEQALLSLNELGYPHGHNNDLGLVPTDSPTSSPILYSTLIRAKQSLLAFMNGEQSLASILLAGGGFQSCSIINIYNQEYESAAAFWPDAHRRIVIALVVSQVFLMGLLSTKQAARSTPFLIALPTLTIWFHKFCKGRFESAFVEYSLQEAMTKGILERAKDPNFSPKAFLQNAYVNPVFKSNDGEKEEECIDEDMELEYDLVPTKRQSRKSMPAPS
ncbi:hypothetical protein Ancab_033439 [Ancistrocladus abbreviatus]